MFTRGAAGADFGAYGGGGGQANFGARHGPIAPGQRVASGSSIGISGSRAQARRQPISRCI